ncbi:unnamed protein product, partial [Durusdinium trenchii]
WKIERRRSSDTCDTSVLEDAFARQQRLRDMQSYVKQMEESGRQRRRYYRGRAVENSHLEREEEYHRFG